jgi:hypothetical protein
VSILSFPLLSLPSMAHGVTNSNNQPSPLQWGHNFVLPELSHFMMTPFFTLPKRTIMVTSDKLTELKALLGPPLPPAKPILSLLLRKVRNLLNLGHQQR